MKNNPFLDTSFLFLTENPNDLNFWSDLGFYQRNAPLLLRMARMDTDWNLKKVAPLLKCYNFYKSSQQGELSGALWWQGGRKKESLQHVSGIWYSTSNSPVAPRRLSCQISTNQCEAEKSANVNEHWKKTNKKNVPRIITSLLMSSPPIRISHRLFRCRYSNSRNVVACCPSFSRPVVARRL